MKQGWYQARNLSLLAHNASFYLVKPSFFQQLNVAYIT